MTSSRCNSTWPMTGTTPLPDRCARRRRQMTERGKYLNKDSGKVRRKNAVSCTVGAESLGPFVLVCSALIAAQTWDPFTSCISLSIIKRRWRRGRKRRENERRLCDSFFVFHLVERRTIEAGADDNWRPGEHEGKKNQDGRLRWEGVSGMTQREGHWHAKSHGHYLVGVSCDSISPHSRRTDHVQWHLVVFHPFSCPTRWPSH